MAIDLETYGLQKVDSNSGTRVHKLAVDIESGGLAAANGTLSIWPTAPKSKERQKKIEFGTPEYHNSCKLCDAILRWRDPNEPAMVCPDCGLSFNSKMCIYHSGDCRCGARQPEFNYENVLKAVRVYKGKFFTKKDTERVLRKTCNFFAPRSGYSLGSAEKKHRLIWASWIYGQPYDSIGSFDVKFEGLSDDALASAVVQFLTLLRIKGVPVNSHRAFLDPFLNEGGFLKRSHVTSKPFSDTAIKDAIGALLKSIKPQFIASANLSDIEPKVSAACPLPEDIEDLDIHSYTASCLMKLTQTSKVKANDKRTERRERRRRATFLDAERLRYGLGGCPRPEQLLSKVRIPLSI